MSTIQRTMFSGARRVSPYKSLNLSCSRRSFTQRLVKENDIVLLKPEANQNSLPTLTKPLKPGDPVVFRDHRKVKAEDVIGKPYRSVVAGGRRALFRIYEPTLGQYCDNAPRVVTPIYSSDASLIVSLLDLHFSAVPSAQSKVAEESEDLEADDIEEGTEISQRTKISESEEMTDAERLEKWDSVKHDDTGRLEIFEAGTGAGSLTLHLARAIHGANRRAPPIPRLAKTKGKVTADDDIYRYGGKFGKKNDKMAKLYDEWRSQRRAVIHSLDADDRHSRHAQRTVRNYRHGAYFPHVDFHVGSIHNYLSTRLEETNDVFLDHAILDIPGIQNEMEIVAKCIKPDGRLITWCPSITQHMECLETVRGKKLPLVLDRLLELGSQLSTGGREWEVRLVKPRALAKAEGKKREEMMAQLEKDEAVSAVEEFLSKISTNTKAGSSRDGENESELDEKDVERSKSESVVVQAGTAGEDGWEMICRPKVGERITGGGFVGVWKKMDMNV